MPAGLPREDPPLKGGITLYVIRHGETDWNAELRYQGQVDHPFE